MRVAFYTRISTDENHQKYSLDAQKDRLDAYCKSQYDDYEVTKIYRDASSGTNMSRPGLEEMLYDAENGVFEVLIVFRVDRLSRNVRQLAQMVETLTDFNVVLRSSTEPFDTSNSAGKMMLQMLGVFAEFEHATIVERTKAGMERKARNGEWCGGFVPYGYQNTEGEIFVNEEEAAVVRRLFRYYVHGKKGATKIYRELNAAGLRKRSGILWDNRALIVILKNPFYTGMIRWKNSVFEGKHEGIISQEMFDKAQAILEKRNIQSNGNRFKKSSDFFLTGLITCGKCGKGLVGRAANRNGHRHKYYSCSNRTYHKSCDLPNIRADIVEVLTVKEIRSIFLNSELLERVWLKVNEQLKSQVPDKQQEIEKIESDLVKTKSALDKYFEAFESGALKPTLFGDKVEELNLRLQQLEEEKSNLDGQIDNLELAVINTQKITEYIETLDSVLESGGNEQKKHLLRAIVEKVLVHDKDKYEFTFRLPDGSTLRHALETVPDQEVKPLSVNHLAQTVCNQDTAAPREQPSS